MGLPLKSLHLCAQFNYQASSFLSHEIIAAWYSRRRISTISGASYRLHYLFHWCGCRCSFRDGSKRSFDGIHEVRDFAQSVEHTTIKSHSKTWRSTCYLLTCMSMASFVGGLVSINADKPSVEVDRRIDWFGSLLVTAGLVQMIYALSQGELAENKWRTPCRFPAIFLNAWKFLRKNRYCHYPHLWVSLQYWLSLLAVLPRKGPVQWVFVSPRFDVASTSQTLHRDACEQPSVGDDPHRLL